MRYEFDHRTGGMVPKKDDSIYFAQSQGGGLIVDDKKNRLRYIIERDGRLTKLSGSFRGDNLNLYDMRDARMISDRVVRLLGRGNKYSDFRCFIRGYHVSESHWSYMNRRSQGTVVRKEDGVYVDTMENDEKTRLVIPNDYDGEIVKFDNGKKYITIEDTTFVIVSDESVDTYYIYDENCETFPNLVKGFETSTYIRNENFGHLIAVMLEVGWSGLELTELGIEENNKYLTFSMGNREYMVFDNYENAEDEAKEDYRNYYENCVTFDKQQIENMMRLFGDGFINEREIKNELVSAFSDEFDDMDTEEKINNLIDVNLVSENEDFFETDEDGDIDLDRPIFDPDDYRDKYVDAMMDSIGDPIDYFIERFGATGIEDYIDFETVATECLNIDGVGHALARYDGKEMEVYVKETDTTYYIYRTN
jgi:hypothetical protein